MLFIQNKSKRNFTHNAVLTSQVDQELRVQQENARQGLCKRLPGSRYERPNLRANIRTQYKTQFKNAIKKHNVRIQYKITL